MIISEHSAIRATDPDDAPWLAALYSDGPLRASLLDGRREPVNPTVDELRETLASKEAAASAFYTIENRSGDIRGFCNARGTNQEAAFGEVNLLLFNEDDLATPLATEAFCFILDRAYGRMRLRKTLTTLLDSETVLRAFLVAQGFESAGVQREVLYAAGRWHNLETMSLTAAAAGLGDAA